MRPPRKTAWGTLVRVLNDVFVMLATAVGGTPARGGIASECRKHPTRLVV